MERLECGKSVEWSDRGYGGITKKESFTHR